MCVLSTNSPHRPTASEPGKSATQAKVDGDYFLYSALARVPTAGGSGRTSCPVLRLSFQFHPYTASEASDNDSPEHFQERAC
jgi:hypothetical protein